MIKMTDWFPSNIKPVRPGVYEVNTPNCRANRYAYFDSQGWRLCNSTVNEAYKHKNWDEYDECSSMNLSESEWRGFTEKQK